MIICNFSRQNSTEVIARLNMHEAPRVGDTLGLVPAGESIFMAMGSTRIFRVEHVMHFVNEGSTGDFIQHEATVCVSDV